MVFCFIRVETSDAVNVAHDGISVATSLVELVVGKHLTESAKVSDVTRLEVEENGEPIVSYEHAEEYGTKDINLTRLSTRKVVKNTV